uniref:Uncharacterized protein n=1 Tax=Arundo donax TaxID=35708 RepID=A0A0A9GDS1_ARUDO
MQRHHTRYWPHINIRNPVAFPRLLVYSRCYLKYAKKS